MIPSLLLSNLPVDPLVLKSSKSIRTNEFSRGMGMEELDLVRGGLQGGSVRAFSVETNLLLFFFCSR